MKVSTKYPIVVLSFLATMLLFAVNLPAAPATLKDQDVIKIASAAARAAGYNLADYGTPVAKYELVKNDGSWSVFFDGKKRYTGNHFIVAVDDRTKKSEVLRGE